jgi:thiol-disulfide isomerase/thioredoxin
MRNLLVIALLVGAAVAAASLAPAQELTIGSRAPALEVETWLKGEPALAFEPGRIYLVEFWATWCGPCVAGMPYLSRLQAQLGDTVTVIGVNIWERPYTDGTRDRVAQFVAANDAKLGYRVAYDGQAQRAATAWMESAGLGSIPNAFLVDRSGVIAFIGHPLAPGFRATISQVIAGTHDLEAARAAREQGRAAEIEALAARTVATRRLKEAVARAVPLALAGDHAAAVAACDTLKDVGEALGTDPCDEARVQVFHSLFKSAGPDAAHAYVDHLLQAGGMDAPSSYGNLAWVMVDPAHGLEGADPVRAVRCSERALADMAAAADTTDQAMMRPLLLDTHAMALAAAGRLEEAIAAQAEAVALVTNEAMKAMMQERLDAYRAGR